MSDIEGALERFEEAWLSGFPPDIASFLTDDQDEPDNLLAELVMLDLEYRWRSAKDGEAPTIASVEANGFSQIPDRPKFEDYSAAFPQRLSRCNRQCRLQLVTEEYRVRSIWGDEPAREEYEARFPDLFVDLDIRFHQVDTEVESSRRDLRDLRQLQPTLACRSADTSVGGSRGTFARVSSAKQFGDYEIIEELARGGMGVVFKARQRKADRLVALKMILAGHLADQQEVQRFYAEAQAAAKLEHPNIVPIYDVGECDGQHYFSMRFVKGTTLKHLVANGPLASVRAARLMQLIAQAVAYAHEQGVIHRDLKTTNVLVDHGDTPHVTDFGLAKQLGSNSDLTATGQVMGTPSYMPPEQASGKIDEVGPLSDVYSLGAILYELLTGRPPFQAAAVVDVLTAVLNQDPVPPRTLNPVIDRDLETICLKCLEKDPQRRYRSATDLAEELDRFLNQEPIRARPVSSLERGWRWCNRHRAISVLSLGLVVSLLIGLAATSYFAVHMQRQAARERAAREEAQREQYAALLSKVELENATRNELGWTWSMQRDLQKALALDVPKNQTKLRTLAAETLLSLDVRSMGTIATDVAIVDICFCATKNQLFVAEGKRGMELRILLYDVETGALVREISHSTVAENFERLTGNVFNFFQGGSKKDVGKFQDGLRVLACSPDGKWLAAGTRFGKVVVWDLEATDAPAQVINAHRSELLRLVFSPDSQRLYTSNKRFQQAAPGIRVWQRESDRWELEKSLPDVGAEFCLSPDGTRLAVINDRYQLWDTKTWSALGGQDREPGRVPTFTNDGRFLVNENGQHLILREVLTGEEVTRFRDPDFGDGYGGDVIQCLGNGYHVVASSYGHEGVRIFDLLSGRRLVNLPSWGKKGPSFCVSRDGKQVAVVESQQVSLYEIRLPLQTYVTPMPEPYVEKLAFSQDGQRLAVLRLGGDESNLRQVVTDILRINAEGAYRLEKRQQVRQGHPPFTKTPHNRPGFIA